MENLNSTTLDEIGKIPLFQGVTREDLLNLVQDAHRKQVHAGGFFFIQGDPSDRMYVLIEGRVKLTQVGPDGQQALIRMITPVTLFALVAMTAFTDYLVTAQAVENSQAFYWTRDELMEFMRRSPVIAVNAMQMMAERLQEIQERFREVTTVKVEKRLAHTLIRLAAQSGKEVEQGTLIDLPLTRQDLAEMSGTTLFTVSRILSHWDDQGLIIASREQVIIRDSNQLSKIVEENHD